MTISVAAKQMNFPRKLEAFPAKHHSTSYELLNSTPLSCNFFKGNMSIFYLKKRQHVIEYIGNCVERTGFLAVQEFTLLGSSHMYTSCLIQEPTTSQAEFLLCDK